MFERIESRAKRVLAIVGAFLLGTLVLCMPVGVLGSSNLVWGEDNQYGRMDVPDTKVLHLPSGSVDVSLAIEIPGRGNGTPDLPFPGDIALSVTSVDGSVRAKVTRDFGSSSNANDNEVNTQRHAFTVDIPKGGDYRVTSHGDFLGIGVNPQFWFGHGPPLPGVYVPLVAAVLALAVGVGWYFLRPRFRRKPAARTAYGLAFLDKGHDNDNVHDRAGDEHGHPAKYHPMVSVDSVDALSRLADLHDRGKLTDDEFAAEKAKIINR